MIGCSSHSQRHLDQVSGSSTGRSATPTRRAGWAWPRTGSRPAGVLRAVDRLAEPQPGVGNPGHHPRRCQRERVPDQCQPVTDTIVHRTCGCLRPPDAQPERYGGGQWNMHAGVVEVRSSTRCGNFGAACWIEASFGRCSRLSGTAPHGRCRTQTRYVARRSAGPHCRRGTGWPTGPLLTTARRPAPALSCSSPPAPPLQRLYPHTPRRYRTPGLPKRNPGVALGNPGHARGHRS
jgi:hypothetical protein